MKSDLPKNKPVNTKSSQPKAGTKAPARPKSKGAKLPRTSGKPTAKQQRNEVASIKSENYFQSIIEQSSEGVTLIDEKGHIIEWNRANEKITGLKRSEVLGMAYWDVVMKMTIPERRTPQNREHIKSTVLGALRTGKSTLFERPIEAELYTQPDRGKRFFHTTIFPIKTENGYHIASLTQDITERKRAENELRESEEQYRSLAENVEAGVATVDTQGTFHYMNPVAAAVLGERPEALIGKTIHELFPAEVAESQLNTVRQVIESGGGMVNETQSIVEDGARWYRNSIQPIRSSGSTMLALIYVIDITERKRAEEALQESEERYRTMVEQSNDMIWVLDTSGNFTYFNQRSTKITGQSFEDWRGKSFAPLIVEEDLPHVVDVFNKTLNGEPQTYEVRVKKGEDVLTLSVNTAPLFKSNRIVGTISFGRDVTERKRAEEILRQREEQYRTLVEQVPAIVYIDDATAGPGQTLYISPQIETILGFTPEKWRQGNLDNWIAHIHPDDRPRTLAEYLRFFKDGEQMDSEYRMIAADGRLVWIRDQAVRLSDETGKPRLIHGMMYDITERKHAEDALHESEKRFRALIENSSDAITMLDAKGIAVYDSPAAPGMLGYAPEDWIGRDVFALIHPDDLPKIRDLFQNLVETPGARVNSTFRVRHKSGSWLWIEMVATNLLSEPSMKAIVLNYRDITERKRAEQEIASLAKFPSENPNPVLRLSLDGIVMYANAASGALLSMWECTVGGSAPQFWRDLAVQALASRENKTVDIECDGKVYSMVVTPVAEPGYVNLYGRDITERKHAEEALHNSEIKLRSLFAAMQDVIIVYDADGRYLEIAPTNPANLYRPFEDMLGKTVMELFPPNQASFFLDHIRQTLKTGQLTNAEYSLSFGGQVRWFSASVSPLSSNSVIWVAHDVTDRKQAEERIKRQLEHLTALNEIDRMIASSFDLHLSLTSIVDRVISQQKIDAADILVMNPDLNILEFGAGHGFHTLGIEKGHLSLGEGYAGRAALERQTIHVPDLREQVDNPLLRKALASENFVSYYAVPLIAKGKVKGVLEIFHRSPLDPDFEWLDFLNTLAGQAAIAIENATLFGNLQRSNTELALAYDATIEGWSRALDLRDKETEGRSLRVAEMVLSLASKFGLRDSELVQIRWGALLHDIGKMGLPDSILFKPDALTEQEWLLMKNHPVFGYKLLSPIGFLRSTLDIPYCHHEKWDGTGYPRGLKGEQIPLAARIFAVIDIWDALTSDRAYRKAWSNEKALDYIKAQTGTHFDPQVVKICFESGVLEHKNQK